MVSDDFAAEEIIARLHGEIAVDTVREALADYDTGETTVLELLAALNGAGDLAARATFKGWAFLYQRAR